MAKKLKATLISGSIYVYNGKFFNLGVPLSVTESEAKYLEENAIRTHNSDGKSFYEPLFKLEDENAPALEPMLGIEEKKNKGGRPRKIAPDATVAPEQA